VWETYFPKTLWLLIIFGNHHVVTVWTRQASKSTHIQLITMSITNPVAINVPLVPAVPPHSSPIAPPPPPLAPIHGVGNDHGGELRPELEDPLFGLELGKHPDIGGPLQSYLLAIPRPDDNGKWNIDDGFMWLETVMVSHCSIYQFFVITNFFYRIP
jgi:hypothetical protein